MLSTILVCLSLTVQLAFCAWVPEREMELAMWRTRWSGVSHYGKLPLNYRSAKDHFEFLDKDTPLENWQQACIHGKDKERRNTTRRGNHYDNRTEGREWKGGIEQNRKEERPWVNPTCDGYSLGVYDTCTFIWYSRPGKDYAFSWRKTDYVTLERPDGHCYFEGPLTARDPSPTNAHMSDRFHPTSASPQRSKNPRLMNMMYRCPSTRPMAIWACLKCGSTSLGSWVLRLDNQSLIERVSQLMDTMTHASSDAYTKGWAITHAILHDFPESITKKELAAIVNRKMATYHQSWKVPRQRNGTNIVVDGIQQTRILARMPTSYCPLCCAWGDGRLKIIVARNPYVRLMSYYRMRMRENSLTFWYEGLSDFRPWLLTFLSHRERTGRFTSDSGDHFHGHLRKYCTQKDPIECGKNNITLDEPCAMECANRRLLITLEDVDHAMPVVDSLLAAGYETHVRERIFQVMHLESIEEDIKDIEERLCREYDDCEPLPEFPRDNKDISHFDAKTRVFSNSTLT